MGARDKYKTSAGALAELAARPSAPSAPDAPTRRRRWSLRGIMRSAPGYLAPAALTCVMTLPLFAPWSLWPLGFVAFVPWLVLVCAAGSAAGVYLVSYLLGAAFFLTHWRWLLITTPPGYVVGSLAFALYFCLAAWLVRHLYRRRQIPVTFAFAVAWILVEMMRSRGALAFPWFLLGHSQIRLLSFVQIADVTGVYGISFAVAMVNGLVADLLLRRKFRVSVFKFQAETGHPQLETGNAKLETPNRLWPAAPVAVVCIIGAMFGYGWWRLSTLKMEPGPTAAVLQGDYLLSADENVTYAQWLALEKEKQGVYLRLVDAASAERPDLFVLPETPWSMYLNRELLDVDAASLSRQAQLLWREKVRTRNEWSQRFGFLARQHDATIVVGAMSEEKQPKGTYPAEHRYNSAFVFGPDGGEPGRYDKIHLVMFGEFVPFRYTIRPLYWWINGLTPWGRGGYEYSLTPGRRFEVFALPQRATATQEADTASGGTASPAPGPQRAGGRFGITICYEDVIPQVFRRFILDGEGRKRVDFMLNISNDGWFGHGTQQAQHLVNCAFRAIENRVGIARSVNTGVSGFIRPDGSWHHLVETDPAWPRAGGTGYQVARLESSPVTTVYARYGDVFGAGVALLGLAAVVDAIATRLRERREARRLRQQDA